MAMTTTAIYPATLPSSHHFQRPTRACKSEKTKFGISSHSIFTSPLRSNPRRIARSGNEQIGSSVEDGFVLEDVPHVTDHIPDLQAHPSPLQNSPAYAVVKQNFVTSDDVVAHRIVVQKNSSRGIHFRRAGPREHVYFKPSEVCACIVTCGGLCPGINTVIREIVCGLTYMYGVSNIFGIEGGYKGFYAKNTIPLAPKTVNDIHKRGGTILQTSRGGHDTNKIVDSIQFRGINQVKRLQFRGINQVYIIGGDGTQKGAAAIYQEVQKRGLRVAVAGIPKTIDNDIVVCFKIL